MSHADTIRAAIENDYTTVGARRGHDALEALLAENERLREALERIAAEWDGNIGTGQMLTDFCREALAGDAE